MPPIRPRSTRVVCSTLQLLVTAAGIVVAGGALLHAQDADLGPAVAGGTGLRGTADATGTDVVNDGPNTTLSNKATLANPTASPKAKFALPKLPNRALPERFPVPLPNLAPYSHAYRLKGSGATEDDLSGVNPPGPNIAALPVIARKTLRPDDNPFGPIGYGVGGLRLLPYIEQGIGYDSNPEQVSTGVKGSAYSRTEGGFAVESEWARHELKGVMHGAYDDFFSNPRANRPDANGVLDLRVDVTRDTKIDAEARFDVETQRPGSPELNVAVADRPLISSFGGTLGATQSFGRFSVGLHGLVDRTMYDDGTLTNGDKVPLAYQDYTDYGTKLRLGYDLKPGLQPFAEVGVDRRIHDDTIDPDGYRRDSDGIGGRIGSTFEFWPQLTGTASIGYATRHYSDPRLKDLRGPTADGTLAYAITPLTTVTLTGSTSFDETNVIGASGIESRVIGVALSHALFRYVTLTAAVAYQRDRYIGADITENTLTESLKAEYHLTRSLVLTGTVSHQRLKSTTPGSDYTQNVAIIGLRLQH